MVYQEFSPKVSLPAGYSMKRKRAFIKRFFLAGGLIVILGCVSLLSRWNVVDIKQQPWIKASSQGFIKDKKPFQFIGSSAVNLVFYDDWGLDVEKAFQTAKKNNISVLRFYLDWGWGKDEDIDRILAIASKYKVYVILTLTDCCCSDDCSNVERYFQVHAPFCNITSRQSREAFKNRIKRIVERRNSINGRLYRDDPTILAWEIANELEYWHFTNEEVFDWLEEMAAYVKLLDKKHLVTVGIPTFDPKFDQDGSLHEMFNAWGVDFFSVHFYPPLEISNFNNTEIFNSCQRQIKLRIKRFLSLGKPVVMGEFGFSNSADLNFKIRHSLDKSEFYLQVYQGLMDTAFSAGAGGVMFWGWGIAQEKEIPMWWSKESHDVTDEGFCDFLRRYQIHRKK